MTETAQDGAAPVATGPDATAARTGMLRVGAGLALGTIGYIAPFAAASTVLLPARIAELAPDDKVQVLALVTAVAAGVALLANIVFGALSDLTRSRLGSRTPWIVGGSVGAALFLLPLARAESIQAMLGWWSLSVACLNASTASVAAILPDRVPVARRATLSAVIGVGILVGHAVGAVVGSLFLTDTAAGFPVLGGLAIVLSVAAVLVAPDLPSPADRTRPRPDLRTVAASFRVPRGVPDFWWVLWGRLALVLGYFMVNGFQLYIFTDHVGLDAEATARALAVNSLLFLGTALVGSAVAGPLSDRLQRRKAFVVAASLLAVVAAGLPFAFATVGGMVGFATVGGIAFGVYYAVDAALMSEVLPDQESRARDLGILNTANTGGQVLAPAASAGLVALGIGFAPVFVGAMVACAIGALCIPPIRSVR